MNILKKVFLILLILDVFGLISEGIALVSMFKVLSGYGEIMMGVASAITAVTVAVLLFEIFAKILFIRSASPAFSWTSGRKGYVFAAKLLFVFNLGTVIISLLATGGEGATWLNQGRLYLQALASVAEMIAVFFYLRIVKNKKKSME